MKVNNPSMADDHCRSAQRIAQVGVFFLRRVLYLAGSCAEVLYGYGFCLCSLKHSG